MLSIAFLLRLCYNIGMVTHDKLHSPESLSRYETLIKTLGARGLIASYEQERATVSLCGHDYYVIGPSTPIDQGASIDIGSKTAIIVDTVRDTALRNFVNKLSPAYNRIACPETRKEGLTGLASVVRRVLSYDSEAVIGLYQEDYQSHEPIVPRGLGDFINMKKGICLQQALLNAAALEHARKTKAIPTNAVISLETEHNKDTAEYHAFTNLLVDSELWRIDSTQPRDKRAVLQTSYT